MNLDGRLESFSDYYFFLERTWVPNFLDLSMLELIDALNAIGIVLEITGFIFLLVQFKDRIFQIARKHADKDMKEWYEKVNKDLDNPPKIPKSQRDFTSGIYQKLFDLTGILFVIVGLGFQLMSILVNAFF